MKRSNSALLSLALGLCFAATALGQHRPGGGQGMPGGMSGGMSNDSSRSAGHGASTAQGAPISGAQGKTMNDRLQTNTKLSSQISKLTGMPATQACSGFKNLGQCVAAAHVAQNLGLSFTDLRSKMTGSGSESLGKAIQDLGGPKVNAKSEAKKANKQAQADLSAS
jgi:hypothetical protein